MTWDWSWITVLLISKFLYLWLILDICHVTAKDWQSVCLSKYRELLDYFCKMIPMFRFTGFSEKSFFFKEKIWNMGEEYGQWCYRFKFLERIRLHWMFHEGFGEIRFLKWWCNQFNFLVFDITKMFFLYIIKANIFFL